MSRLTVPRTKRDPPLVGARRGRHGEPQSQGGLRQGCSGAAGRGAAGGAAPARGSTGQGPRRRAQARGRLSAETKHQLIRGEQGRWRPGQAQVGGSAGSAADRRVLGPRADAVDRGRRRRARQPQVRGGDAPGAARQVGSGAERDGESTRQTTSGTERGRAEPAAGIRRVTHQRPPRRGHRPRRRTRGQRERTQRRVQSHLRLQRRRLRRRLLSHAHRRGRSAPGEDRVDAARS